MNLGEEIRRLRRTQKLSLTDLAKASGVTGSYISQVERSLINPTVGKLSFICKGLGISLGDLFNSGPPVADGLPESRVAVVRKDMRKSFTMPQSHLQYFLLSPDLRRKMEFVLTVVPGWSTSGEDICHEGEEACLILSGTMNLTVASEQIVLSEGDSVYFDSALPHRWENQSADELRAVWVITPPSF